MSLDLKSGCCMSVLDNLLTGASLYVKGGRSDHSSHLDGNYLEKLFF